MRAGPWWAQWRKYLRIVEDHAAEVRAEAEALRQVRAAATQRSYFVDLSWTTEAIRQSIPS